MDNNLYINLLGKLLSNLQSIEYILRAFLLKFHEKHEPPVNISTLNAGDLVPINSFTNYDSLGQLITKYNAIIQTENPEYAVNSMVVTIRDMLAHGRVASLSPTYPMHLLKFGQPKDKLVPVESSTKIDQKWLESKLDFTHDEIRKIQNASRQLGMNIMRDI